jgi:type I restriction enzyme S subunit
MAEALNLTIPKLLPNPDWAKLPLFDRHGWQRLPFGAFAESINERVEPANAAEEIYVGLDDLDSGSLHIRRWGKGSDVIGTKLRFCKGDLIFGRRRAYQRKLAVAEMDGICSAHAMVVRAKPDVVLPEFLPFLMMSDKFMSRAVEISVGSLSPTINWTTLKLQEFDLPPLDQQRRIAEILWAVDEAVTEYRNLTAEFKKYSTLAIWKALEQGPPSTPERKSQNWPQRQLGDICDLQNGRGFAASEWSQEGLPIIRIQNLNGSSEFNYFAGKPEASWLVEPGTLLFAWAGVRGVSFGPCIWPGPLGVLNQHIYRIVPGSGINRRWLFEILKVITVDIEKKAHGFKIELVHVRKGDITSQVIPVPPLAIQEEIAHYAASLEATAEGISRQTTGFRELNSGFLNTCFSKDTP